MDALLSNEYHRHRSGLYLPYKRRPTCIDLFCGCGGFSLGVMQAGFDVVAAVDWDAEALLTYMVNLGSYPIEIHYISPSDKDRLNKAVERETKQRRRNGIEIPLLSGSGCIRSHPEMPGVKHVWMGDVRKLKGQDMLAALGMERGDVDLVVGGPPCQGFSTSGKRDVMDERNSLVFEYARLVLEIQPKTFCMENVPGILTMVTPEGLPVIDVFCRIISDGGFAPFNALKKSLLASAGVGAAMKSTRGNAAKDEPGEEQDESDDGPQQESLF